MYSFLFDLVASSDTMAFMNDIDAKLQSLGQTILKKAKNAKKISKEKLAQRKPRKSILIPQENAEENVRFS